MRCVHVCSSMQGDHPPDTELSDVVGKEHFRRIAFSCKGLHVIAGKHLTHSTHTCICIQANVQHIFKLNVYVCAPCFQVGLMYNKQHVSSTCQFTHVSSFVTPKWSPPPQWHCFSLWFCHIIVYIACVYGLGIRQGCDHILCACLWCVGTCSFAFAFCPVPVCLSLLCLFSVSSLSLLTCFLLLYPFCYVYWFFVLQPRQRNMAAYSCGAERPDTMHERWREPRRRALIWWWVCNHN